MSPCKECSDRAMLSRSPGAVAQAHCTDDELPADPFLALRVAHGMLLGEDDFRVLMGNPRGKQMLHSAWLHGAGQVWGMAVGDNGKGQLTVAPGLAIDEMGRELRLEITQCLDVAEWRSSWQEKHKPDEHGRYTAWLIAEFAGCPDRPVPALADPCDVTRRHDSASRIVETVRISVVPDRPGSPDAYRRLRVLLGLEPPRPGQDEDAVSAQSIVRRTRPRDRPAELLNQFHLMAALDEQSRAPSGSDHCLAQFPTDDEHAGVTLARLTFTVSKGHGSAEASDVEVVPERHTAILPTTVIQDLLCGLAPGLITPESADSGGPQLVTAHWLRRSEVALQFDRPIMRGSWEGAISVSSLSSNGRGWRDEHVDDVEPHFGDLALVVRLDSRPAYDHVRVVVRGTGPTPLFGADPVEPFAGWQGGSSPPLDDGRDAAFNAYLPRRTAERTE